MNYNTKGLHFRLEIKALIVRIMRRDPYLRMLNLPQVLHYSPPPLPLSQWVARALETPSNIGGISHTMYECLPAYTGITSLIPTDITRAEPAVRHKS